MTTSILPCPFYAPKSKANASHFHFAQKSSNSRPILQDLSGLGLGGGNLLAVLVVPDTRRGSAVATANTGADTVDVSMIWFKGGVHYWDCMYAKVTAASVMSSV